MIAPSGYTTTDVVAIIDSVAKYLAPSFVFGYYDLEDIEQEARLEGLRGLEAYDYSRGSLYTFMTKHIRNRLINLKRDKFMRPTSPCDCCNECKYNIETECPRYRKWSSTNRAKRTLAESSNSEYIEPAFLDDDVLKQEILTKIDAELPVALRADYRRFIEGTKIPKMRLDRVLDAIREIVNG